MDIKKILGIVVGVALVGSIVYFNQPQQSTNGKKNVYAILPLTGPYSPQGKEEKKSMETYMASHPNAPFNLEFFDNESIPSKSLSIAQQISLRDKSPLFTCAIGALCRPIIPLLKEMNGFMLLSPSTQAEKTDNKEFQRISINHEEMNEPFIKHLNKGQTVVIIHSNEEAGSTGADLVANKFKEKGVVVLDKLSYMPSELDTRILVLKAISKNPEAILIIGAPTPGFVNVIKTLRKEQDYKGIVMCDTSLQTPSVMSLFGSELNGVLVSILPIERIYQKHPDVVSELKKANLELYNFPIIMYDLLDIITYFLNNNIAFSQENFMKLNKWEGISTDIRFLPNGNSVYDYILASIKDGKFISVESEVK